MAKILVDELIHELARRDKYTEMVSNSIPILDITESRDIEAVKAAIRLKYGFEVTSRYAADLINFIEMIVEGDTSVQE